jgi:hypothetical protein
LEKALQHGNSAQRGVLIAELIDEQSDGTNQIFKLLKDAYGNFPVQVSFYTSLSPTKLISRPHSKLLNMLNEKRYFHES